MQVKINGKQEDITPPMSLVDLLGYLEMSGKRVAIELNQTIIPRSQHLTTFLQEGDEVEVIQAIAGG